MLNAHEQHSRRKLAVTVLSILVIAGVVVFADHAKSKDSASASNIVAQSSQSATAPDTTSSTPATSDASSGTSSSTSASAGSYKDGSYSASSSYFVPRGNESIKVNLTLSGGTVTDVSVTNSEGDPESAQFQEDFTSLYKSYVVGKQISGLRLSIIAGASDTTDGFNEALSQIASQAQA